MGLHYDNLRKRFICLAVLILSLSSIAASQATELTKITLQLKWLHQFQFAGYYAAIEKGFYEEEGLHVILKEGLPGVSYTDELIAGRADYGIDMPIILLERNYGKPVVVLASIFQHSPEVLISRKDSEIASPHDLIGKRILMRPQGHAEIRAMLKNEGISEKQLKIIDHTWEINDLIEGKVDVSGSYITDVPFLMQERGIPSSIISPLTYGIDFYGDCLFTTEKKINQSPGQVKAFLNASLKGWEYAMSHSEEIIDLILEKYSTRLSREALRYEATAMHKLMQPKFIEIGHMNPGRWKHIAETFVELNMLTSEYTLEGFLYNPNPQLKYDKMIRVIWVISAIALVIGVATIILFLFNRSLNQKVIERTKKLSKEIADRKKTRVELEKSEVKFRTLVETSPVAIAIIRHDQYLYVNLSWMQLTGYSKEEAMGLNPLETVHPDMREQIRKNAENRLNSEEVETRYEMKGITKAGDVIWYDFSAALIEYENKPAILSFIVDITGRKDIEQEREMNIKKLKRALDEINTLRGIVPICSSCKKIRDDKGYWNILESYIQKHSKASFSHGMCPECSEKFYGDKDWYIDMKKKKGIK